MTRQGKDRGTTDRQTCCTTDPQQTPWARTQRGCCTASPKAGLQEQLWGWGMITAPTRERDVLLDRGAQATTSGEANQGQGSGKQSRWWQELPGAPGHTHMWPAERPRAQIALATLKHTTGDTLSDDTGDVPPPRAGAHVCAAAPSQAVGELHE